MASYFTTPAVGDACFIMCRGDVHEIEEVQNLRVRVICSQRLYPYNECRTVTAPISCEQCAARQE